MQLFINLDTKEWYIRVVQSGSPTGWSELIPYNRQSALHLIECGYTFEYTNDTQEGNKS